MEDCGRGCLWIVSHPTRNSIRLFVASLIIGPPTPTISTLPNKLKPETLSHLSSMASSIIIGPPTPTISTLPNKLNYFPLKISRKLVQHHGERGFCFLTKAQTSSMIATQPKVEDDDANPNDYGVVSMHHVGILCENLETSLHFYQNLLGLKVNEARPHDKLPYRGAWLWVGSEMIHLMELSNPDPLTGRPEHGGRDRHTCIAIRDVFKLKAILDKAGHPYTLSRSGRPAIFTRDPDANALEFTQVE